MSQASPLSRDWTEQRALCGSSVYVWQINLASLLAVLFVAFVGFDFSTPFIPFLVRRLGVTDPRAVAVWSGKPRTARRNTSDQHCPLATPADQLLFLLVYLQTYPLRKTR